MTGPTRPEAPLRVLAVDAATSVGSVAVLVDGMPRAERTVTMRGARDEVLMPAVADALAHAGVTLGALDAVVCGGGPGSFTSLRIAGAIAKGLAVACDLPLLAAPSLALVPVPEAGRWLVTLDALRGERYAALVTVAAAEASTAPAVVGYVYLGVVAADALPGLGASHGALGVVDANATIPVARAAAGFGLALPGGRRGAGAAALVLAPVDLALWEPDYGRKAEAQVQWEARHGHALPADASGVVRAGDTAAEPSTAVGG